MNAEHRAARTNGLAGAIAASAGFHTLALLFLIWRLGDGPGVADAPVTNVQLATLPHAARRPLPEPLRRREPVPTAAAPSTQPPFPNLIAPQRVQPDGPAGPGEAAAGGNDVRSALRGLVGCRNADLARLSPDERRRCEARALADAGRGKTGSAARFNFDLNGRYAENPEAYLNRRPKNGCKARVGGDVAPMGEQGGAGGVTCALSF